MLPKKWIVISAPLALSLMVSSAWASETVSSESTAPHWVQKLADKTEAVWDKTKEKTEAMVEKTADKASDVWDKTKAGTARVIEKTKEKTAQGWDKTKEVASDAAKATKEKVEELKK